MLSVAGPCPPFGVHPGSDVRGPVVQPSGVQPSGVQPADWCPAGWCVRPSGVRPAGVSARPVSGRLVSARPSGHLRLACGSPGVALGITSVRRATFTTGTDRVARGLRCPSGSVDGPSRPRGGRPGGGRAEAGGGVAVADLAGSCSGAGCGRGRPLTGQGPARREGRPSLPAEPGMGVRAEV
jgi:hypothetical protein